MTLTVLELASLVLFCCLCGGFALFAVGLFLGLIGSSILLSQEAGRLVAVANLHSQAIVAQAREEILAERNKLSMIVAALDPKDPAPVIPKKDLH